MSHSGALAGDDRAHDALFERHGVLRVRDADEMIATLQMAVQPRLAWAPAASWRSPIPAGSGSIWPISPPSAGRPLRASARPRRGSWAGRLEYGLAPVNPLDAWGTGHDYVGIFTDCWNALMDDPDAAMGLWVADMRDGESYRGHFIAGAHAAALRTGKPMAFAAAVPNGVVHETARELAALGIPFIDGLGPALTAANRMMAWRDHRPARAMAAPAPPDDATVSRWRARLAAGGVLDEAEGLALARAFGVPAVAATIVESAGETVRAARAIAGPCALKTAMPGVLHKTDAGGVVLGLADADAARRAWQAMSARLGPRCLIAPMAPAGVEMAFGLVRDPQFGPLVTVGAGGVLIELLDDAALAVPPFDAAFARKLIDRLRIRPLLDGARGRPAADIAALAEALARFSTLAATLGGSIDELDLNPVVAGPDGAVAVDALVAPAAASRKETP